MHVIMIRQHSRILGCVLPICTSSERLTLSDIFSKQPFVIVPDWCIHPNAMSRTTSVFCANSPSHLAMDEGTNNLCSSCHSFMTKYYRYRKIGVSYQTGCFSVLEASARVGCPLCGIIVAAVASQASTPLRHLRSDQSPLTLRSPSLLFLGGTLFIKFASGMPLGLLSMPISRAPADELFGMDVLQDASLVEERFFNKPRSLDEDPDEALDHIYQWGMHCTRRDGANMPQKICDLTTEAGQQEMAERVKQWLTTCFNLHEQCGAQQDRHEGLPPLPSRVLDVGTLEQPYLRLHIPGNGERGEYTCLSYCWGRGVTEFKTTAATVNDLRDGIPFPELPKTIQDAIVFTRRLQVRYLWVDALCIIQDDTSDPSDWQLEAARFGTYYQNALCTLAATGSYDSSEGLFLPSLDRMYPTYFCTWLFASHPTQLYCTWIPSVGDTASLVSRAPLSLRGWAAQERILSPRIVHFTCRYVMWECTELFASERSPNQETLTPDDSIGDLRRVFSKPNATAGDPSTGWGTFCRWYVKTTFSRQSDRLPALSGVVQRIQSYTGLKYYAGLWENNIVEGLDWFVKHSERIPKNQVLVGPSWSWTTSTGNLFCKKMSWETLPNPPENCQADSPQIDSIEVQSTGQGIDGVTISGVITITGALSKLNLAELTYEQHDVDENRWEMEDNTNGICIHWDRLPLEVEVGSSYACLQLTAFTFRRNGYVNALILMPESVDTNGIVEYRRVGHCRFRQDFWDKGEPERKTIKLV